MIQFVDSAPSSSARDAMRELLDTGLASFFDPDPIRFRQLHEGGVAPVRRLLRLACGVQHTLQRGLSRNKFLLGCLDYTEHANVEHLVLGFGERQGQGTRISRMLHFIGDASSVAIPSTAWDQVRQHVASSPDAEVVVFHNHPIGVLGLLLDSLPIASTPDRLALLTLKYFSPLFALKTLLSAGSIRFYLGENGFVREFRTPGVVEMVSRLARILRAS